MTIRTIKKKGLTTRRQTIGGLHSIDFMIYGSITKFGSPVSDVGIGRSQGILNLFGQQEQQVLDTLQSKKITTQMAVDLKVTRVSNGQIILADTVSGQAGQGKAFRAGGVTVNRQISRHVKRLRSSHNFR